MAIKNGMNYIDTAPFYGRGESQKILGVALKDVPREAYYIATAIAKYDQTSERRFNFTAKKVTESFENSLENLGLSYVDIIQVSYKTLAIGRRIMLNTKTYHFQIHDTEWKEENLDIILTETLPTLQGFINTGKARFIGISAWPMSVLKRAIERAPASSFDVSIRSLMN